MATQTTTLPSATLAALDGEAAHVSVGKRLFRNTLWSGIGSAAPMLVAVVAVPRLIHGLGADRFGILALAWMAIGYLSLLDFGLGRAITRLVADRIALGHEDELAGIFWDAHLLLLGVGVAGGALVWGLGDVLLDHALKIPPALHMEARNCVHIIAVAIPIVVLANGLRGFLEAHQHFRAVNVVRVIVGITGFLVPLMLLHWTARVDATVAVLSLVRTITVGAFVILCIRVRPAIGTHRRLGTTPLGPLLRFGGWITFDNLIGPLMISVDRFIIGTLLSVGMTTYYVTPQEMMTKLLILPMALQQAIFPAFSRVDRRVGAMLYRRSVDSILLLMLPLTLIAMLFAREGLTLWVGGAFAAQSFRVLEWLAVGILINSIAHVPSSMIQAIGRPEVNAKIHTLELPIYLVLAWWLIAHYGILGAAIAWVIRAAIDTTCFFIAGYGVLPMVPFSVRNMVIAFALVGGAVQLTSMTHHLLPKILYLAAATAVTAVLALPLMKRTPVLVEA
jgi:O-antigen/teichoic acid export membrane protein